MTVKKHMEYGCLYDNQGHSFNDGSPLEEQIKGIYIELVGSTSPQAIKEIYFSSGQEKNQGQDISPAIYEYLWTVAIMGNVDAHENGGRWYEKLDDDGIIIQLIFHISKSSYSLKEIAANLKLLPPYKKIKGFADWFEPLQPFIKLAGESVQLAGLETTGKLISAISGMKMNSIPSTEEFPWFIKTFSCFVKPEPGVERQIEPGIEWHIPKSLIGIIGNRIQGSVGIIFVEGDASDSIKDKCITIEMRAFLRDKQKRELFLCDINNPIKLELSL